MSLLLSFFSQLTFTYIKAHSCNNFLCTLILQALKIKFENNAIVYASIGFPWKIQKCLRFLLKAKITIRRISENISFLIENSFNFR